MRGNDISSSSLVSELAGHSIDLRLMRKIGINIGARLKISTLGAATMISKNELARCRAHG